MDPNDSGTLQACSIGQSHGPDNGTQVKRLKFTVAGCAPGIPGRQGIASEWSNQDILGPDIPPQEDRQIHGLDDGAEGTACHLSPYTLYLIV